MVPTAAAGPVPEMTRLSVYKAAIAAGLYTDACLEPRSSNRTFTAVELGRLAIYRAAIKARFYADSIQQGSDTECF